MRPLLLVLGCERSGTSAVARVAHELGFCMGHRLAPGDEDNPLGYYEERMMRTPSFRLTQKELTPEDWLAALERAHPECNAPGWGVKHPILCNAAPGDIRRLRPTVLAITTRTEGQVVYSLAWTKHKIGAPAAAEIWRRRTRGIVRLLRELGEDIANEVFLMDKKLTDEEIRAGLERALS